MLCYVHIPKTAGTTLNYVFQNSLAHRFVVVEPWIDIRRVLSPADVVLLKRLMPWATCISSHYVRANVGLEHVDPEITYFTIMREPIARYVSAYNHFKDINHRVANIYEYLNNKAWNNIQTKYIVGCDDVEAAKQILREKFAFVGQVERMDESLVLMRKLLPGGPDDILYGAPKNVARNKVRSPAGKDVWGDYAEWAKENNRADMELYRFVTDELYPAQCERYGATLEEDVVRFKADNAVAPVKRVLWAYQASRIFYKQLLRYYRARGWKNYKIDNGKLSVQYDYFGEYVF